MRFGSLALVGLLAAAGCTGVADTSSSTQEAIGPANITSSAASYNFLSPITINWSGMPGSNAAEWIAIAPQGSPNSTVTRWSTTGGAASGMRTFEGPPAAGTYVARGFDQNDVFQGESDPFTVAGAGMATVTPGQPMYAMTDPIVINWSGMPGNTTDWISIAPQGSPDTTTADWLYTNGGTSGSTMFDGIAPTNYPPGPYVARAFVNDSFTKIGESVVFNVVLAGGATITTNAAMYNVQAPITVTWTGLPGTPTDWVSLAPQGSPVTTVTAWSYTGGAANGNHVFNPGISTPGTYVARAFDQDGYTIRAQSAPFTVSSVSGVTVTTDASAYTVGQNVVVTWTNTPGNANDWIAISPQGSSDTTVTRWVYTGGQANGMFTFEGPAGAGTYVARVYVSDSYTKVAESASFTVN